MAGLQAVLWDVDGVIAESERDKVFQPFYRALGTDVDGSGLGLAIVREIALAHGAEIALDDTRSLRPGQPAEDGQGPGARFTVRFTAQPAAAAPPDADPPAPLSAA